MRRRDIRIFKIRSHTGVGILSEYQDLCHILPCGDVSSTSAVHAPPLQPPLLKIAYYTRSSHRNNFGPQEQHDCMFSRCRVPTITSTVPCLRRPACPNDDVRPYHEVPPSLISRSGMGNSPPEMVTGSLPLTRICYEENMKRERTRETSNVPSFRCSKRNFLNREFSRVGVPVISGILF